MRPRVAILVLAASALVPVPGRGEHGCLSHTDYLYDSARAGTSFTFDLAACGERGTNVGTMQAWVSVQRENAAPVRKDVECAAGSLCHVEVELGHFPVELAYYRFHWQYRTTGPEYMAGGAHMEGGCASYIVRYGCPPPILPG